MTEIRPYRPAAWRWELRRGAVAALLAATALAGCQTATPTGVMTTVETAQSSQENIG